MRRATSRSESPSATPTATSARSAIERRLPVSSSMSRRTTPPSGRSTICRPPADMSTWERICRVVNPRAASPSTSRRSSGVIRRRRFTCPSNGALFPVGAGIATPLVVPQPHGTAQVLRGPLENARQSRYVAAHSSLAQPSTTPAIPAQQSGGVAADRAPTFSVARNPEEASRLPFLIRLPLASGPLVLKAGDSWPRTARVYCHRADAWPDRPELVDEAPVRSCIRRGIAIDLVLDRPRQSRSQV